MRIILYEGKNKMIIHRKMDWTYGLTRFDIYIDGAFADKLGILKTKEFNLLAGEHEIGCGIDGDITYEKIFIGEIDNIRLECRISPILDMSFLPLILIAIIYYFNRPCYSIMLLLLSQLLFITIQLIGFMVLSYKNKLIKIKKL